MIIKPDKNEQRTEKQLLQHYRVEKELADRLRNASKNERRVLYGLLYEELYRLVPDHPQLTRKKSPQLKQESLDYQFKLIEFLLDENKTFLEVGSGDCAFSFKITERVKKVYGVDVSKTITETSNIPENFELILSDGCSIPVPEGSIDIVYSNQLMEHLHPDDAFEQLKNILRALAPGGVYVCITPSRLTGPHDISKYFDTVATGFHLKKYTITELSSLFKSVGFSKVKIYIGKKGKFFTFPVLPSVICERILGFLPYGLRHKLTRTMPMKMLISDRLFGYKCDT